MIIRSFVTVISFMIAAAYYGLTECALTSEPFTGCQSYKVGCDIIPGTNFDFNCSATIPAFSGMKCAQLHPPPDVCEQLTVVSTTPGVTAVADGGLANVMVGANCSSKFNTWYRIISGKFTSFVHNIQY